MPRGKPGELLVRAHGADPRAGFFSGYLNDPAATEEAWQGGWFHTGDFVSAEADGLMYFFDRKKTIVRRSGENIGVLEVESALTGTRDRRLRGNARSRRNPRRGGFRVHRAEEKIDEAGALAASIVNTCAESLAYHKVPGYVAFVESLPLSSTKKLARGEIKLLGAKAVGDGDGTRSARAEGAVAPRLSTGCCRKSMIRKSGNRFSLATNAERVCAEIMLK